MSRLYLRLPSNAAADTVTDVRHVACAYALVTGGRIEQEGVAPLSELSVTLGKVDRVTLLLAASDVTVLRVRLAPLSPARLKAALPNVVEEHLISDPGECAIVAGPSVDGLRSAAVVQRAWLTTIAKALSGQGAQTLVAVPAQLCLALAEGGASAAVETRAEEIAVTVRLSVHEGFGFTLPAASSAHDVLEALSVAVRDGPLRLYVAEPMMPAYRDAIEAMPALAPRVTLDREGWPCWLDGVESVGMNLLAGLDAREGAEHPSRRWRWPAALAAVFVAVNVVGLYADWWRMKSEADRLRAEMTQTFRSAYPKETVILDPLAQMKQKVAAGRRAAGQLGPDDFLTLVARFGEAWTEAAPRAPGQEAPRIAALEYRNRSLAVRLPKEADAQGEALAAALKARGFAFTQSGADGWQIRSVK